MAKDKKKICVLSLDGGGIRGILSGEIVHALEKKLQTQSGKPLKIGDYFDFIAGTSTGGIMACSYLVPDASGNAKYGAADAEQIYTEKGDEIFKREPLRNIMSLFYNELYSVESLEKELKDFFQETLLSDLIKPCLITSYDIENRNAKFFNSAEAYKSNRNFKVRDLVRATSAAPTYFEPAAIESQDGTLFHLIDGGVYANNPALCAYAEVRTMEFEKLKKENGDKVKPKAKDMLIVSIGTGQVKKPYPFNELKNAGKISWIEPIIDILMSGNAETVDYQLKQIYKTLPDADEHDYYRLEPELFGASAEMDDVSEKNIKDLIQAGKHFADKHDALLDEIARKILDYC